MSFYNAGYASYHAGVAYDDYANYYWRCGWLDARYDYWYN